MTALVVPNDLGSGNDMKDWIQFMYFVRMHERMYVCYSSILFELNMRYRFVNVGYDKQNIS